MQAGLRQDSIRHGLIAMLPRLKRFADLLVGDKEEGRALLRRALIRMLSERHRYRREIPLDHWAFAEIYRRWLNEHRDQTDALVKVKPMRANFERLFHEREGTGFDRLTADFLWQLPPQQRSALLLVYGEGFDHEAAGSVLDTTADTIAARLILASAGLADRLRASMSARVSSGDTETLPRVLQGNDHDRAQ